MSTQLDNILSAYHSLARIPSLTSAKILKNGSVILSNWNERNPERKTTSKIQFSHHIDKDFKIISDSVFGTDVTNVLMSAISPSETYKGVLRETFDSKNDKKQYLEIWKHKNMKNCVELDSLDIHGNIYSDGEFGCFNWNTTEDSVLYIAEKKLDKSEPFHKRMTEKSIKTDNSASTKVPKGMEYDYKQEWGEQLVGKHLSSIVICKPETETFNIVDWLPESWCPGQVTWSPNSTTIVGVAWETEPRRLGLIFCTNRESLIFSTSLIDKKTVIISQKGKSVRSPRFSSDGKYLMWLQRDEAGPHNNCHELVKTSWPITENPKIDIVVDVVNDEVEIDNGEVFTGIYSKEFPERSFSIDGKRVAFSTPQKFENRSYIVNTETGRIVDISDKSISCSTVILDVHQDIILASRSSYKIPSQLIIAKLPKIGEENTINWILIEENSISIPDISNSEIDYMNLEHTNVPDTLKKFTALYFGNSASSSVKSPLIIYPHGGPHSSFVNTFSMDIALLRTLGFSLVMINYRGSIGAGQDSVLFLPGKVGVADVNDCMLTTDVATTKYNVDGENCALFGGSHGGFLATHISGQFADRFKAVATRNPVIDIASQMNSTDIPDWCAFEAGSNFNQIGPVDNDLLMKMRESSPLMHAHKVKAPTLLCIGSKDQRVPYFQGIEFYHKIRANGCKARMLVYDDNHSLNSVAVEMNYLINSALWFFEHLI